MPATRERSFIPLRAAGGGRAEFRRQPPLSLYVHIPWCVRKCPYCDFNSHALAAQGAKTAASPAIPQDDYLTALIADLESALPLVWGRRIDSIFIGGGTPSLLSGGAVEELLAALRSRLPLLPGAEITLEANPGTIESGSFAAYRAAGVNRLSLGVQSFNRQHLQALGRIHDGHQARQAIAEAVRHFDNLNLDLMYGLPGQEIEQALADIETALSFAPAHLSCYQLTIEANTAFAAQPPLLPEPDLCADMQDAIEGRLAAAGYRHYETSAFAQPGRQCQHNLNYWHFGDYLGIGAGAHGKLTLHDRVLRQMRWKRPEQYLAQAAAGTPVQEEFTVAAAELPCEFMLNALRLVDGFDARLFESRCALPLQLIEPQLLQAERAGLLERNGQRIAPTEQGRRFLNRMLEFFLVDRD
ncbi:radical SAM family heme chaperone HemW [Accumulibacter sp.]|uniref:radical SAM family heme chaperone HemW n=1 Tax=Accumulibacter sp. TaxID=2053492 RepID=UPI0025D7C41D|nr:radical SAM family heme chaperone HemW [Accumulibacter sp.]MCM8613256.1 radical SAM family heme chaperone HemW [Accumulibacter sp.]MCM8636920.1 radical SAM family heme chaperone HemW [Accumulibacter sp.]MCM8638908.1 radical SAM family heme chaperone HemW [Accumulibacter sp.]